VAFSHWPGWCPCCCPCHRRGRPRRRRCRCRRRLCCCRRHHRRRLRRRRCLRHRRRCPPQTSPRSPPRPRSTPTHPSPRARCAGRPGCRSRPPRQSPRSRLNHQTTPGERRGPETLWTRRGTPPLSTPSRQSPPREESAHACAYHRSVARNCYPSYSCP
jgi:hypothetical protein